MPKITIWDYITSPDSLEREIEQEMLQTEQEALDCVSFNELDSQRESLIIENIVRGGAII